MEEGELHLIIGPMMAGKTTALLERLFNEVVAIKDCKAIYINHENDTRSDEPYSTHNPLYKEKLSQQSKVDMVSVKRVRYVLDLKEYDIIGIDESHFFSHLYEDVIELVDRKNKIVHVAGLNGDKNREHIGDIHRLIPHMTTCTFKTASCHDCGSKKVKKTGIFSYKFQDIGNDVGGGDKYIPLCRKCFINRQCQT